MTYSAYKLTDASRALLLSRVPVVHSRVIAEHITYKFPSKTLPPECRKALVLFEAHDDNVQAVGVTLVYDEDNTNAIRPDGGVFHVTLSVGPNGSPRMSNDMLANTGGTPLEVFEIEVEPVVL